MGTHLRELSMSYPMNTNMMGFKCNFKNLCVLNLYFPVEWWLICSLYVPFRNGSLTGGQQSKFMMHYDKLDRHEVKDLLISFLYIVKNLSEGKLPRDWIVRKTDHWNLSFFRSTIVFMEKSGFMSFVSVLTHWRLQQPKSAWHFWWNLADKSKRHLEKNHYLEYYKKSTSNI